MSLIEVELPAAPTSRRPGAPDRPPFRVRHHLSATGLLELGRIAQLADALPAASVEHNLGALPAVLPGGAAPRLDAAPGDVVRGIETNGSWMVLKNVEQDPEYAALLASCVAEVEPHVTGHEGPAVLREGFVFLSCPGSVTPAHLDHEHNVLLQVRGTKTMSIGRYEDDAALRTQAEALHSGAHRNLASAPLDLQDFLLEPGDGVYVPVHAPHVVRNGPEVSISLSVTWHTPQTLRSGRVHGLNAVLRQRGLPAAPPGGAVWRDEVKAFTWRARGAVRRQLHRDPR